MKHIDNLFTIAYMLFGLFLVLVGVKDSNIYLWESVGLILIGGSLVVIATNVMLDEMGV